MKNRHVWVYDGKGGGHRGEFDFDCTICGATDWVSGADLTRGKTPSTVGCSGVKGETGSVVRELDDYARGVADERARVVAALKKRAWALPKLVRQELLTAAERLERGLHEQEATWTTT